MTETAIFQTGKVTQIRLRKELAETLNNFAAENHISEKTETLHRYIKSLKSVVPEKPQIELALPEQTVFCRGMIPNRMIGVDSCRICQKNFTFETVCSKVKNPICREIKI